MDKRLGKILDKFTEELKAHLAGSLESLVLYGSATLEKYDRRRSDINLAIVVKGLNDELLDKTARLLQQWRRRTNIEPIILDSAAVAKSGCTSFCIEFLEIHDNYLLLSGNDLFKDVFHRSMASSTLPYSILECFFAEANHVKGSLVMEMKYPFG